MLGGVPPPVAAATLVGATLAGQVARGKFDAGGAFRVIVGGFIVGLALYGLNAANGQIGSAFSWFIVVVAMLANGIPVLERIHQL